MNIALVFSTLGKLLIIQSVLELPALGVSFIFSDGCHWAFIWSILCVLGAGLPLALLIRPRSKTLYTRDSMAVAGLSWIAISFFGSLPLVFSRVCGSADAFFEIASGFTTTGATIFSNVEILPQSITFWRCFTHWVGGMGVLVLTTALLPSSSGTGSRLAKAESAGPSFSKLMPKLVDNSKVLYIIYAALTLVLAIALRIAGMDTFDSILHAFSTAGTGGFSNRAASIGYYGSLPIELICGGFMLLFGLNFAVYFKVLAGDFKGAFKNEELWTFLGVCGVSILLIALNISSISGGFANGLRQSFFQVSSVVSTTGFSSADFDVWPVFSKIMLLLIMLAGSCAGSTAGGLKMIRVILLAKLFGRELGKSFMPRKVKVIKLDGKPVPEEMLSQISVYFFVYVVIAIAGVVTLSLCGCDVAESVSGSIACVSNIGPGFGRLGPMGGFGWLPPAGKVIMALIMLAGRLEFYPMLMLLVPASWRKN